jgi:hypothetical protein
MQQPVHRWIRYVLALALAVLPVRGVLAMPEFSLAGSMAHCARMQPAAPGRQALPMPGRDAHGTSPCPGCNHGCGGHHCKHPCPCFVPAFSAIDNYLHCAVFDRIRVQPAAFAERYSDRAARPPYRPPIPRS